MDEINKLQEKLQAFADERDWDQFHSPKNLSMALSVEASELLECFQWLSEEQSINLSEKQLDSVTDEIADVQIYLLRIATKLNIDLLSAVEQKIIKNASKYPSDKVRGSAKKYTEYKTNDINDSDSQG